MCKRKYAGVHGHVENLTKCDVGINDLKTEDYIKCKSEMQITMCYILSTIVTKLLKQMVVMDLLYKCYISFNKEYTYGNNNIFCLILQLM